MGIFANLRPDSVGYFGKRIFKYGMGKFEREKGDWNSSEVEGRSERE